MNLSSAEYIFSEHVSLKTSIHPGNFLATIIALSCSSEGSLVLSAISIAVFPNNLYSFLFLVVTLAFKTFDKSIIGLDIEPQNASTTLNLNLPTPVGPESGGAFCTWPRSRPASRLDGPNKRPGWHRRHIPRTGWPLPSTQTTAEALVAEAAAPVAATPVATAPVASGASKTFAPGGQYRGRNWPRR